MLLIYWKYDKCQELYFFQPSEGGYGYLIFSVAIWDPLPLRFTVHTAVQVVYSLYIRTRYNIWNVDVIINFVLLCTHVRECPCLTQQHARMRILGRPSSIIHHHITVVVLSKAAYIAIHSTHHTQVNACTCGNTAYILYYSTVCMCCMYVLHK